VVDRAVTGPSTSDALASAADEIALAPGPGDLRWRHPVEADHAGLVGLIDDWHGGRRVHGAFGRFLLRHFSATSLLAEADGGRVASYLVGFVSPDLPAEAFVHSAAVNPNRRRQGIGRELYRRFELLAAQRGAERLVVHVWPGDPIAVAFHRGIGFDPQTGPGTMALYGTPAYPDYDFPGEDRAIFVRPIR
jgi:ribosomal protein S18 acetylase RimI-like enzyme